MKFLVDRCAGATLARWLRDKGHDVQEARERGPDPGDEALLGQAVAEGRVLVTLDKDFGALVFAKGKAHSGVVRLPDVPAAARIALFERLLAAHQKELAEGAVFTVRGDRVRISR
jgi:predicted nuclease of predicted toxin-antitoxin system